MWNMGMAERSPQMTNTIPLRARYLGWSNLGTRNITNAVAQKKYSSPRYMLLHSILYKHTFHTYHASPSRRTSSKWEGCCYQQSWCWCLHSPFSLGSCGTFHCDPWRDGKMKKNRGKWWRRPCARKGGLRYVIIYKAYILLHNVPSSQEAPWRSASSQGNRTQGSQWCALAHPPTYRLNVPGTWLPSSGTPSCAHAMPCHAQMRRHPWFPLPNVREAPWPRLWTSWNYPRILYRARGLRWRWQHVRHIALLFRIVRRRCG